ncbi:MAG TPA: 2-oxo-4-hydroxy-4-carboxy-5-ureidoimidazoline decarboxylase [Longimicrobiales bacterium]|nr:2-oxo-4-hydroxy-4-carboxy-5-ureidoimidazoline decarboxylase [Longimicrobiales bacterium]
MTLKLTSLPDTELADALAACGLTGGAARLVLEQGPFSDDAELCMAVDSVTTTLSADDLRQALEAIPEPAVERGDPDAHQAALLAIRLYRERFGYPFVSGVDTPTAEELLMRVRIRLGNDPEPEGRAAREHLRRLIRRGIQKLQERDLEV